LEPSRSTSRRTEISVKRPNSPGTRLWGLSNTSSTEARPWALRLMEPLKMTSVMFSPRRWRAELSPAPSARVDDVDLPQPLGLTTAVMSALSSMRVGSTNDLKPASLINFRRMAVMW
jgi:hypothetical protein